MRVAIADRVIDASKLAGPEEVAEENVGAGELQVAGDTDRAVEVAGEGRDDRSVIARIGIDDGAGKDRAAGGGRGVEAIGAVELEVLEFNAAVLVGIEPPAEGQPA